MTHEAPQRRAAMQSSLAGSTAASPALPQVRLVADLVCPWCYLGFQRLMALAEGEPFRLIWHPFLLNPHLPAEGIPRALYLERRFGGARQAETVQRRAAAAASAEGLVVRPELIRRQPNTLLAHAMVLRAGEQAAGLVRALFEAFFREGADLGSVSQLALIGGRFGIGIDEARAATQEAMAAHDHACRSGVDGVPVFLFGEDHAIAGAQPTACLEAMLHLERYRLSRPAAQGRQAS